MPETKPRPLRKTSTRSRPGPISSAEAEERHQRILAAARSLFVAHGLTRTTFDAIAREARITKRTIYLQYRSKEGLFVAALQDCVDAIAVTARQATADRPDLASTLIGIAESYAQALDNEETLAMYRLAIGENARIPVAARHAINLYGEHSAVGVVTLQLQAAQARGLVEFASLPAFVHLFLDWILAPRFTRWLIGEVPGNAPGDIADAVHRFLKATDDLFRIPAR